MRKPYVTRKVWIKRYLMEQLNVSERQLYRLLGGDYSAKNSGKLIRQQGYKEPLDRRSKAAKALKPPIQPQDNDSELW